MAEAAQQLVQKLRHELNVKREGGEEQSQQLLRPEEAGVTCHVCFRLCLDTCHPHHEISHLRYVFGYVWTRVTRTMRPRSCGRPRSHRLGGQVWEVGKYEARVPPRTCMSRPNAWRRGEVTWGMLGRETALGVGVGSALGTAKHACK